MRVEQRADRPAGKICSTVSRISAAHAWSPPSTITTPSLLSAHSTFAFGPITSAIASESRKTPSFRELCTRGSRPRERAANRDARERRCATQQLAARGIGNDLRHERSSNNHVVFASSSNSTSDAAANTQNRIMITLRVA